MKAFKLFIFLFAFVHPVMAQSAYKPGIPIILRTGSNRILVLDTAFYMPQLYRKREIRVYLPPGYNQVKKRFPVIYLQDGERVEDSIGSKPLYMLSRMDSLYAAGKSQCIIVGIFSSPEYRQREYNPFDNGEGVKYINFLTNTLKPFIDKSFKTLPGKDHSIIAGINQGATIALYATLSRPNIFGKAGIFSPDLSSIDSLKSVVLNLSPAFDNKLFFYSTVNVDQTKFEDLTDIIGQKSSAMIYKMMENISDEKGNALARWFPEFTLWMNADGYNYVFKPW
ncbi:MAG: alpha/beta hydrolase-fold protein [Ferruginibacter sp.]